MEYWIGIDCGGTVLKAGLYDSTGKEIGIARHNLSNDSPHPGWVERDMGILWLTCAEVIRDVLLQSKILPASVCGVAISAQGKGLFLLDKKNKPLGKAILSSDQRALNLVHQWQQDHIPEYIYPLSRQTLWTGHPGTLLYWVKENQPERYQNIGSVLMAHDYLRACLTGELACEETNISESNFYNMEQGCYDDTLLEMQGISDIKASLPNVIKSAQYAGKVSENAAQQTGLHAGTPVYGGLFDVVSTALCAGLHDESYLNAVLGTWSVTSGITDHIDDHQCEKFVYGRSAQPGTYIVHAASPTSAGNLEWFIKQWGNINYNEINRLVEELPKAVSQVFFVPFLYGSNAGSGMSAGFYGLQSIHQQKHLLQAIYEGVIFSHVNHLNFLLRRFPKVKALRVTGGPARSSVWMQMLADVSNFSVELPKIEETGCLGAALTAMVGGGVFKDFFAAQQYIQPQQQLLHPDPDAFPVYQNKFKRYQALVAALAQFQTRSDQIRFSGD